MQAAEQTGLFSRHQLDTAAAVKVPGGWNNATFVPYDYGYFAFVYNKEKLKNPRSLHELVDSSEPWKVIYQDPRTSTPGLGLLLWMQQVYGEQAPQAWQKLAKKRLPSPKAGAKPTVCF